MIFLDWLSFFAKKDGIKHCRELKMKKVIITKTSSDHEGEFEIK